MVLPSTKILLLLRGLRNLTIEKRNKTYEFENAIDSTWNFPSRLAMGSDPC
jgi:hypothetical protein